MPIRITALPNGRYEVRTPSGVKAKATTKEKAEAQARLLEEADSRKKPGRRRW